MKRKIPEKEIMQIADKLLVSLKITFISDSDEERTSRKDLLGKKREKRESKKDKGYAALEGESSGDDDETRFSLALYIYLFIYYIFI